MSADGDHEVIDSPEALIRHLYEEHGVEEARDLDPETAPVQFWLRRHAELEREQRLARRDAEPRPQPPPRPNPRTAPEPPSRPAPGRGPGRPGPGAAGRDGRRPAGFGDPLVEAVARALAGRGHDEAAVRAAIRSFAGAGGEPTGEAAVRVAFVDPMLQSVAERLLGAAGSGRPASRSQPPPAQSLPPAPSPPPAQSPPPPAPSPPPAVAEQVRPEAAWAVLWADLADTGRRSGGDPGTAGDDGDDLMAVANAVQQRRRVRLLRR
jgi:hypothetical protein